MYYIAYNALETLQNDSNSRFLYGIFLHSNFAAFNPLTLNGYYTYRHVYGFKKIVQFATQYICAFCTIFIINICFLPVED
jgi:hypothetical protein